MDGRRGASECKIAASGQVGVRCGGAFWREDSLSRSSFDESIGWWELVVGIAVLVKVHEVVAFRLVAFWLPTSQC